MVLTRLQTGAISTRKYTPLNISLHDLSLTSPTSPTRPQYRKNGPGSPTKVIKPRGGRKGSLAGPMSPKQKIRSAAARLTTAELELLDTSLRHSTGKSKEAVTPTQRICPAPRTKRSKKVVTPKIPADMCPGNTVFPSTIFGAREEVGLSKIGRADKEVRQWEEVLVCHQQNVPELVPIVEEKLQAAKDRRACLDDHLLENYQVGDIDPAATAIKARLEALQYGLDTSQFGPEAENIKCAMAAYKSGEIGYNKHYTIIYGGHVVDTAPTYNDFVIDRLSRLDRYFTLHGEGWMWYEPPLQIHPESKLKACATATLQREDNWSSLGPYYIQQGYWKRSNFVRRMAQTKGQVPTPYENTFLRDPNDPTLVHCQNEGPRLSFRSMLDSGATFPSLHVEDRDALGIDNQAYGAQSLSVAQTANGQITVRIWELFVCVLDENGSQLVDPYNAVYPLSHHYVGGLCPVVECTNALSYDENGVEVSHRLSGMLPFASAYLSSAPTRNYLFLGEDRNDVLGSHRMPGQKKWAIELQRIEPGLPFDRYGNPKTRFNHREGLIVDEDDPRVPHCSVITFSLPDGTQHFVNSNPGARQWDNALNQWVHTNQAVGGGGGGGA